MAIPAVGRAFLNTIDDGESKGSYNIIYGGSHFNSYDQHPNKLVAIPGKTTAKGNQLYSSAAGRYQFIKPTWDRVSKELGLTDFSPASQDEAAWQLAKEDYHTYSGGRSLESDLKAGNKGSYIAQKLTPTWESLGSKTARNTFDTRFTRNLTSSNGGPTPPMGMESDNFAVGSEIDLGAVGGTHHVGAGDTAGKIAKEYGVDLTSLLNANPQITNPDKIYKGENITIPGVSNTEGGNSVKGNAPYLNSVLPNDAGYGVRGLSGSGSTVKPNQIQLDGFGVGGTGSLNDSRTDTLMHPAATTNTSFDSNHSSDPIANFLSSMAETLSGKPPAPAQVETPVKHWAPSGSDLLATSNPSRITTVAPAPPSAPPPSLSPTVQTLQSQSGGGGVLGMAHAIAGVTQQPHTNLSILGGLVAAGVAHIPGVTDPTFVAANTATHPTEYNAYAPQPTIAAINADLNAPTATSSPTPAAPANANGGFDLGGFLTGVSQQAGGLLTAAGTKAGELVETVKTGAPAVIANAAPDIVRQILGTVQGRSAILDPMMAEAFTGKPYSYSTGSSKELAESNGGNPVTMKDGDSFQGTSNSGKSYTVGQKYENSRGEIVTAQPDGSFK
jgi:muramidase (phage lysozyme)/LysM repeat protein